MSRMVGRVRIGRAGGAVTVDILNGADQWVCTNVPLAEFIPALEAELGVTVVEGALPEVTWGDGANAPTDALRTGHGWHKPLSPEWHRDLARHHLALAAYVEAHPPVDEAQVAALTNALHEAREAPYLSVDGYRTMARRLVEAGVRAPEVQA